MRGPGDDEVDIFVAEPEDYRHLVRIDPDLPSEAAALHLRFWQQFTDQQIADVLGTTPNRLKMENTLMTVPTTSQPITLDSASFDLREFLSSDPTDATIVAGLVETEESEEHFLSLEALLKIGDGIGGMAQVDLSVMTGLDSEEDRLDALNALMVSVGKAKALRDYVTQFVSTYIDAALEGVTVIKSYGDGFTAIDDIADEFGEES